ncbi:MAG TPA: EamA family transporter [Frankiaceae bacterium]|nr:EamA family transporter [Frankiaceae bacterium]
MSSTPAPLLVVGAVVSVQIGGALAKHVIDDVGPAAATALRLLFAAVVLALLWRPRIPRQGLPLILLYGVTLAAMNLLFYEALARAPLGAVVTVEFLGPLGVAVAGSRRVRDVGVVILAGLGILLLARGGGSVSLIGLLFAALAGACWAGYILVSAAVGRVHSDSTPLALAMAVAAVISLPFGAARGWHADTRSLLLGAAIGILSSVLPYTLELEALRRLPARMFGVLMSMEPAVAALAGMAILGETLTARQWGGVACVIVACVAVTLGQRRAPAVPAGSDFPTSAVKPRGRSRELSGLDTDEGFARGRQ